MFTKNISQQNNSSAKKNFPYFAPWYCRDYQYMWRRENKFHFSACLTQFFCSMAVTVRPLNIHWIPSMVEIWRFSVLYLSNSFSWNVVAFEALWRCSVPITQSTYLSYTENCLQYNVEIRIIYLVPGGNFSLPVWKASFTSMLHAV